MDVVEIRVPTYKRTRLLRRALASLRAQTYPHWRCVVFDDSPQGEAAAVCATLADPRIVYRQNLVNLGITCNIDQCFRKQPYLGGTWLCILEDDNYFMPELLVNNIGIATRHGVKMVLRNQVVEQVKLPDEPDLLMEESVLDHFYEEGLMSAEVFKISLFFTIGVANSGLFWHRDCASNLEVGSGVTDVILQEYVRTFRLRDAIYLAMRPLVVWRDNQGETNRPQLSGLQAWGAFLRRARAIQVMRARVYDELARGRALDELRTTRFLVSLSRREEGVRQARRVWPSASALPPRRRLELAVKALALRHLVPPPAGFLAALA